MSICSPFNPLRDDFRQLLLLALHILHIRNCHNRPVSSNPFEQSGKVLEEVPFDCMLLYLGPSMKNKPEKTLAVQVKGYTILPSEAKTRCFPFDMFRN